ncbi:NADP-dependent oxidoreductase [Gordonia sp. (in: high G+C Gram-positive bacteria)]|uniref:NADP-dependent oxidoreductase n=1 Tax=Gordonia sp. (in: high G+C Gram-positive bacteria) TaxID=84139 RepID=UPI0033405563
MDVIAREVILARRPANRQDFGGFEIVERAVPSVRAGHVLVESTALSIDPSMIPRLTADTYAPKFAIGDVIESRAVGRVIETADERLSVGDWVLHSGGWRDRAVVDAATASLIEPTDAVPPETWLGVLGAPGLTAFVGLAVAEFTSDDVLWVSGAAGAVGSAVVQLAKSRGAGTVIGSAGGADKCRYLTDVVGVDAAIDYRAGDLVSAVRSATDGLDVYFDNIGGSHLEAALATMNVGGRIVSCGMIETYGTRGPAAPRNLTEIITRRLSMTGMLVTDHLEMRAAFLAEAVPLVESGRLASETTRFSGLESVADGFASLLSGDGKLGKTVIDLT